MLNGDVLTDIDLTAELRQHERTGARATLALYRGRRHLELRRRADGRRGGEVEAFLEKAEGRRADQPDQRRRLRARARGGRGRSRPGARSPSSARSSRSSSATASTATLAEGYWIDIGTPERYLEAT